MKDNINRIQKQLERMRSSAPTVKKPAKSLLGNRPEPEQEEDQLTKLNRYIDEIRSHKEELLRGRK